MDPPKRTTAEFRAEGGNAKLLKHAYDDAYASALKDFEGKNRMYRWGLDEKHVKILANLAGGYARVAVANLAFELRSQFLNSTATKEDFEAATVEAVPKPIDAAKKP